MWVRKRIDIGWSDLAYGIAQSLWAPDRRAVARRIEENWSDAGDTLACLSVRTGFDLLLQVLRLPPQSEVLMSAVTIGDMVRIVRHHELVPVPVDLDMQRLAPKLDVMQRAIGPATRAIVVAHLFGSHVPMEPILQIARRHRLLVIEDCAQAFAGTSYLGHPQSDVVMFSFGPIKTATALGGALLQVRDQALLQQMRALYATYPVQSRMAYLRRLLKYGVIKVVSTRWFLGAVARICRLFGRDHDGLANRVARGFAGPGFFDRIRQQPSAPLLAVLQRRLEHFDWERLEQRIARGQLLAEALDGVVTRPGAAAAGHCHWVFPVEVNQPRQLMENLWRAGFDGTQGQSQCVVEPPEDRPELAPDEARQSVARTVFLPFTPEMPPRCLYRMAEVVRQQCEAELAVAEQPACREATAAVPDQTTVVPPA